MTTDYTPSGDTSNPTRIASCVLFWDQHQRLCLQLRDAFPDIPAPGQWGTFGGQIESGETPLVAAIRELEEELGISLTPDQLTPFAISASPRGVRLFTHLCTRTIEPHEITLREGAGFAYLTKSQLDSLPILPAVQTVLHHFFETFPSFR